MERLTKRVGRFIEVKGRNSLYPDKERESAPISSGIVRLAAYEDSGLTPEEVADLANIVQCKDCKNVTCHSPSGLHCQILRRYMKETDFCSCGEKKGE